MPGTLKSVVSALVLIPSAAYGQDLGFLTRLFSTVNSVSVTAQAGSFLDSDELRTRGRCGFCGSGLEVMFDVTPLHAETPFHLELGLAVNHLSGLAAVSKHDSIDLHGAFRSNPALSARLWWDHGHRNWLLRRIVPFGGINAGLVESVNLRAYDTDRQQYTLETRTLEMGAHLGAYLRVKGPFGIFLEPSVTRRRFASIDYKLPSGAMDLPQGWPRSLNADSWQVRIGAQFRVKEEATPRLTGIWLATSLNGQALPAIASQSPTPDDDKTFTRIEIVSGVLVLEPGDSTYSLTLMQRVSKLATDGKGLTHIVEPLVPTAPDTGRYEIEGDELTLSSGTRRQRGSISATEVRVQLEPSKHLVVFKRQN